MTRKLYSRECSKCGSATLGFHGTAWQCSNGCNPPLPDASDELAKPIEVQLTVGELRRLEELAVLQGVTISDVMAMALAAFARSGRSKPTKN